ncbi:MAG: hypothetical protein A3K10_01830 [Bacteroidetes bacterium RIFCSPLOWO2_12_FULL_31_6]|nr:MAG: hypothetical protein A3K10_01830 [Bacteroidetes bacterium RIFCSPLOWO2_12_FULL_31_6]
MEHTEEYREHTEFAGDMKKQIWKSFGIIFSLTLLNIVIYLSLLGNNFTLKNYIFVAICLVKAYYIVFTFMHLKMEKKMLRYFIIVPIVFIFYLLIITLTEGNSISFLKYIYK